ncbi:ankyrin repeat domain-containing protein [Deinococcus radiodurans R1 = ATCC 13939 = DSM 20539]|nr:ankyrin repeat domain-containing protein [Deinococcus radiodurans]UDL01737.1 ankyrin repeat domain-containing protein [Deinococcus radiodurans R1 = ATCC 13939 = DSM 20539]
MLLEQGADSHAAQPGGWTPLLLAVREGAADLVAELLTRGADPHARTNDGESAADLARDNEHEGLLRQFPVLAQAGTESQDAPPRPN